MSFFVVADDAPSGFLYWLPLFYGSCGRQRSGSAAAQHGYDFSRRPAYRFGGRDQSAFLTFRFHHEEERQFNSQGENASDFTPDESPGLPPQTGRHADRRTRSARKKKDCDYHYHEQQDHSVVGIKHDALRDLPSICSARDRGGYPGA